MGITELVLIAIGLAMDAFAVSIGKGLVMKTVQYRDTFLLALFFGGFQTLMPLLGYFLGIHFADLIQSYDHWIAFILLVVIGGHMILESVEEKRKEKAEAASLASTEGDLSPSSKDVFEPIGFGTLFILAVATSIDALAVGVTFALLPGLNIFYSAGLIGIITACISFAGVLIGRFFGGVFQEGAGILGGVILILIGTKILLEHMGFLVF